MAGRTSRPLVSVVVPVFNVGGFVGACLESVRSQHEQDLEIIAVDDGSTDDSPAVLAEIARVEPRLTVVSQPNAGLGAARNTGVRHATGEFLWFVDSDDLMAPGAIDLLLATVIATGSDLATGNVVRLAGPDTSPARFLAEAFARNRLRTHIRRFPPLIADRVAWNKLYRRSFWDRHGFEFPEGVHYEDQYVALPAHYLASAVDVHRDPVYLWRVRDESDGASITQQRADPQSMRDRVRAVEYVSRFLAERSLARDKRRYDESAVTHDLRYFIEVYDRAGDDYQVAFLAAVRPYLDGIDPRSFDRLPAVRRLQWEAVRAGDGQRLADLVRFEREDLDGVVASRIGRRWYLPLPAAPGTRGDVPVSRELRLRSGIEELAVGRRRVRIAGRASVDHVGPVGGRLSMVAVPAGGAAPLVLRTRVDGDGRYVAEVSLATLRRLSRGGRRTWRLVLHGRDHGLRRIAVWHDGDAALRRAARVFVAEPGAVPQEVSLVRAGRGRLTLTVGGRPPTVRDARIDALGVLDLVGDLGDVAATAQLAVGVARSVGEEVRSTASVHVDDAGFVARLTLTGVAACGPGRWPVELQTPSGNRGLVASAPSMRTTVGDRPIEVGADDAGYLVVTVG
jgi:glycosyltransferase involved in cell wall biosynthesis